MALPPETARPRFLAWLLAALLALVTIALYWPVTGYGFVNFDDSDYVTANPHVLGGLTWESIGWALTNLDVGLWHPLTWISHMLDCQWFGLRPGWHHLTSVLLHAANTVLLFLVLRGMTGALWRSALVAALFALHPLHVESVAWVAERKDVLSTFFVLLTLWAYHRYSKTRMQNPVIRTTQRAMPLGSHASRFTFHSFGFYLLSLCFFALGLMSKPMIVMLPALLLLLDYWPLGRMQNAEASDTEHATRNTQHTSRFTFHVSRSRVFRLVLEKLPFLVLAVLTGLITLHAAQGAGSLPSAAQYPMTGRLANAILAYARYLWEVFWPGNLAVYYPFPETFSVWSVAGAALLLVGISVAALSLAGRWPYLVVGWLWYLAALLPVIGLIQLADYSHADRYTYVPLIGVFLGLSWGAGELVNHWRGPVLGCAVAVVGVVILLCLVRAREQVGFWKDSETLFGHALAVTKDNWLAHINLGEALREKGDIDEAIRQYEEAVRLAPRFPDAHDNLGVALARKGQIDEAIRQYQEALRLNPSHANAHYNLGNALGKKGQSEEAIRQYQEALRVKPDHAEAHGNLGIALAKSGQTDEAIRQYQEALRLKPNLADAHNGLGAALYKQGQIDEAIRHLLEALRLNPDDADAHYNLGVAFYQQGRSAEAIGQFQEVLRLNPSHAEAHNNLGTALGLKGETEEAIRHFQEALRLNPDYADARRNLAIVLATKAQPSQAPSAATNR
jgi:tetratricopeptide (TPR) repeat protein